MSTENNTVKMAFVKNEDGTQHHGACHLVYNVDELYYCPTQGKPSGTDVEESYLFSPCLPPDMNANADEISWMEVYYPELAEELEKRRILLHRASSHFYIRKQDNDLYTLTTFHDIVFGAMQVPSSEEIDNPVLMEQIESYYEKYPWVIPPLISAVWDRETDVLRAINWEKEKESLEGRIVVMYEDRTHIPSYDIVGVVTRDDEEGECYLKRFEFNLDVRDYVPELK